MDYKNIVKFGYDKVADRYVAERQVSVKDAENVRLTRRGGSANSGIISARDWSCPRV